jgi:acetaldehyde dehydrogenase
VAGVPRGKAIIILNPAEPPLIMRNTVLCFSEPADQDAIAKSVSDMVNEVRAYVPGYRLKQDVQFDVFDEGKPLRMPAGEPRAGLKTTIFLEIEGAGHYLPPYAGNLDIMTSAALKTGERIAEALWN